MTKRNKEDVLAVVKASRGIAAQIARELGVGRRTFYRYMETWPEVRQAYEDASEDLLDDAESKLYEKAIDEGETASLHFLLATKGKGRGYTKRVEQEHSGDPASPLQVEHTHAISDDDKDWYKDVFTALGVVLGADAAPGSPGAEDE